MTRLQALRMRAGIPQILTGEPPVQGGGAEALDRAIGALPTPISGNDDGHDEDRIACAKRGLMWDPTTGRCEGDPAPTVTKPTPTTTPKPTTTTPTTPTTTPREYVSTDDGMRRGAVAIVVMGVLAVGLLSVLGRPRTAAQVR